MINEDIEDFRHTFNLNVFIITEIGQRPSKPNIFIYRIEQNLWHLYYKDKSSIYVPFIYKNKIRELI